MSAETRKFAMSHQPAITYDAAGAGPLVVFLHGIGGNRTNWREQLPAFAEAGYQAVAWDARGYGDSEDYDGPLAFQDFSSDLARFLDHLDVEQAHLVGLSMGGRILQDFYPRHRHRVTTLTLCATMPGFSETMTPEGKAEFIRLRKQPLLEGCSAEDMAPAVARTLLGPNATPDHYNRLVASIAALHVDSYIKTIEATVLFDQSVDLAAITCPTLLLFGEADTLAPPKIGRRMHTAISNSEFHLLPSTGHLLNIEKPQEFNHLVLDFLARHGFGQGPSPSGQ